MQSLSFTALRIHKLAISFIIGSIMSFSSFAAEDAFKFKVDNDWGSGFTGSITVKNTTAATLKNWKIQLDFPYDITNIWNAEKLSKSNDTYTIIHPSWNQDLAPGESHSFGFNASPGNVNSYPVNVLLSGEGNNPANAPPLANNDTITTDENTPISIHVLNNDSDADGDILSIIYVSTPQNGAANNIGSIIEYYPNTGFYGKDTFNYTISDGKGNESSATVEIDVLPLMNANNPPSATADSAATLQNREVIIDVLNNDTDIDNDNLSIINVTTPSSGNAVILNNKISYTPNNNFIGTDLLTYFISDNNGGEASANVSVTVKAETVNPQVAFMVTDSWDSGFNGKFIITNTTDTDFSAWTLEFDFLHQISSLWNGLLINAGDNHYIVNNADWNGSIKAGASISIGFTASKNGNVEEPTNIRLNGIPIDDPTEPKIEAANDNSTTIEGMPVTISPTENDIGDELKLISTTPSTNSATIKIDGTNIIYTPPSGFTGTDSFSYTIEDKYGKTALGLITVTVTPKQLPNQPIANNDTVYTVPGKVVEITPLANDSDPGGGNLTITNTTSPSNGAISLNGTTITYTPNANFTGTDTFNYTVQNSAGLNATALITIFIRESSNINKAIVGYWQNWYDERYIKLGDVSSKYNIIDVAFAMPKSDTDMTVVFNLDTAGTSKTEFIEDIKQLQSEGRKVLISLGGATSPAVKLNTETDKQKFVSSIISIIKEYGFNGLDIDLEGGSVGLNPGDSDFKNPTTPSMINLISAIKEIHDHFGADNFMLTTAPETAYVQGGYGGYNGFWGAYLPLLYGLRNDLDLIHVQYYNSGSIYGADGEAYYPGTPDFLVALSESLLKGFPVNRDPNNLFPPFRPDQVAIGLLTVASEGSGYMESAEINKALDYLTKGIPYGGKYKLQQVGGYPDFGGIMGWSINYDKAVNNYGFADNAYNYFYTTQPTPANYTITTEITGTGTSYPEYVQPMAGNPLYAKGDKVTFNNSAYESLIDNNSWSPANYPGGWKSIAGSSSAGGAISPGENTVVVKGENQTFIITPDSGSIIKDVKIDNISMGQIATYTFSNVTTNHTISVEFEEIGTPVSNIPPTITYTAPSGNEVITQSELSPITIATNAQDSDGSIESIIIEVDNQTFTESNVSWTPSIFGYHVITATATDNDGDTATIQMTVQITQTVIDPDPNPDPTPDPDPIPDPDPNPTPTPTIGGKQVIGYFTQWEGWYGQAQGYPAEGVANQLNIDYSKFTMLNYSFFGVAKDGSLHSGDYRNKEIWRTGTVQEPNNLLHTGQYDSWDLWYLFGELDFKWNLTDKMVEEGYIIEGNNWSNTKTGLKGTLPIPVSKEGGAPGLIQLCKENNVKLMASIGGWSMCKHFPEMAANPIMKAKFLESVKYLMNLGFDGIDIDWEYPGSKGMNIENHSDADYANFTALMRDIRTVIGPDKLLTAAFSCDPVKLEKLEWSQLNISMDYYNMMTYDMNGGWSDVTGHNSLLYSKDGGYSWDRTYKYLTEVKGINPEKVNMGIAFYGRGVVTEGPAYLKATTKKKDIIVNPDGPVYRASDVDTWGDKYIEQPNYFYIKQKTTGWTHLCDDDAKVPYSFNGSSFVSYDNEKSIELKADYIKDKQLGGVIIWHVTGDWNVGSVTATYGGKLKKAQVTTPLLDVINKVFTSNSDDNKPVTTNYSFPQHINYALSHILPNNYTQTVMDADVKSYYDYWKQNYLISAGTSNDKQMYRISYNGDTVSEGQGYGMIITAIMAGHDSDAKNIFDGLFYYAKANPSEINSNFMDWSMRTTTGNDSAFDGDADIAYALLIADKQWGSASGINYKFEAEKIITALQNNLFSESTLLPLLGDWVNKNDTYYGNISRPSDFMLANFKAFGLASANNGWDNIINSCISKLQYIQTSFSPNTGLVPDFIKNGDPVIGTVLESNNDGKYFYNACRVPLRIGVFALLDNNLGSKAIVEKISNWAAIKASENPSNFYAGYELDGSAFENYTSTAFTAPMGIAAMCAKQQSWLNNIYANTRVNHSNAYYEDTLSMISLLIMTGNFWDSSIKQ
jgi:GH18 family chitinase/endo-1,4-beta-D-glucanase Y